MPNTCQHAYTWVVSKGRKHTYPTSIRNLDNLGLDNISPIFFIRKIQIPCHPYELIKYFHVFHAMTNTLPDRLRDTMPIESELISLNPSWKNEK